MYIVKKKQIKTILVISIVAVLLAAWGGVVGINKTIDKTVSVRVFENNDGTHKQSSVGISGNLKKALFSNNSFVGSFAIEYCEPTCRDGVEAKISWQDDYQNIVFYNAGDFTRFDIALIEIDENMEEMMIVFNDGTIIATENRYIPGEIWMRYQPLK